MESKQKLVCPDRNVQKQIMFPNVHADIKRLTWLSASSLQIPIENLTCPWSFRDITVLFPINAFSLLLFAGFLLL